MSDQQTVIRSVTPPAATDGAALAVDAQFRDSRLYDNRELSWVDFDARVLELAEQQDGNAVLAGALATADEHDLRARLAALVAAARERAERA